MSKHTLNNHCRFATRGRGSIPRGHEQAWEHHEIHLNSGRKFGIRRHQDLKHASPQLSERPHGTQVAADCGVLI